MTIKNTTLDVPTPSRECFVDITTKIQRFIEESGVQEGRILLFVPHTTAAVTINENADPDVTTDMLHALRKTFPDDKAFRHAEGNSDAHIKSSFIGPDLQVPVEKGRMKLGTWQGIYFCEFDGPRSRRLDVQIMGG